MDNMLHRVRRWQHHRDLEQILAHYRTRTGQDGEAPPPHSDAGSFHEQLNRLFGLAHRSELEHLAKLARSAVNICLANQYYRIEDYLSDVIDDLTRQTFLGQEAGGEPPLRELHPVQRAHKIGRVMQQWLSPAKAAALEHVAAVASQELEDQIGSEKLGAFKKEAARVIALLDANECDYTADRICRFLRVWKLHPAHQRKHPDLAEALRGVLSALHGQDLPSGSDALMLREPGLSRRLSTLRPQQRQHLLAASLDRLGVT